MKNYTTPESTRQINNLVARIKAHYPHLYEETGGKFIRKILKNLLETADERVYYANSSPSMVELKKNYASNSHMETRILKHKGPQQRAA